MRAASDKSGFFSDGLAADCNRFQSVADTSTAISTPPTRDHLRPFCQTDIQQLIETRFFVLNGPYIHGNTPDLTGHLFGHFDEKRKDFGGLPEVAQITSQKRIGGYFDGVTVNAAKVMHLESSRLEAVCDASFVLLQARDAVEANRLKVWRKGKLVAETPEAVARLLLPERAPATRFMHSR